MEQYEVRKLTKDYITEHINKYIDDYYSMYNDNIGYLLYYPLLSVEFRFQELRENAQRGVPERYAMSWFIREMLQKGVDFNLELEFKETDFKKFQNRSFKEICSLYKDFLMCEQVMDMSSIAKSEFEEFEPNKFRFTSALIEGGLRKDYIYYHGIGNPNFDSEREIKDRVHIRIFERYIKKFGPKAYEELKKIEVNIDNDLLNLCNESVRIDLNNLGGNVKSSIIKNIEDLTVMVGFYYYYSVVNQFASYVGRMFGKSSTKELLCEYDVEWFIEKAIDTTKLSRGKVEKYLNYFRFVDKGSLQEFPILFHKDKIFFIPSSWILNDFQYSIVNGHYYKKETFKNRDKTISYSVVKTIINKVEKYENIVFEQEKYYEFYDENSEKINSDVDVILYDEISNTFIIIECKWKENHYVEAGEENYWKIHQSLNEIYTEQISKHKAFINDDKNKLSYLLNGKVKPEDISDNPNILYIAVDKRSQLYIDDYMMVPLNGLIVLMDISSENNILHLDKLAIHLKKQTTKAAYLNVFESKEIKISQEVTLVTEDLESF